MSLLPDNLLTCHQEIPSFIDQLEVAEGSVEKDGLELAAKMRNRTEGNCLWLIHCNLNIKSIFLVFIFHIYVYVHIYVDVTLTIRTCYWMIFRARRLTFLSLEQ